MRSVAAFLLLSCWGTACRESIDADHGAAVESLSAAAAPTVTINWNQTYQTIDGFGASQSGGDLRQVPVQDHAYELYCWPSSASEACNGGPDRERVMDLAFSALNGVGLTILRMKINAKMEPSPGVWDYQDPAQVWIMQQAARRGPVKIMASVWSPPGWMKTNGRTLGGTCSNTGAPCVCNAHCGAPGVACDAGTNENPPSDVGPPYCITASVAPSHDQHFAEFLSHFAKEYAAANNVSIYGVSLTNEPDTAGVNWDTCSWSSAHIASFLANNLAPTFASNGVTAKVIAPEAADWDFVDTVAPPYPLPPGPYLHDTEWTVPNALGRLDIAAGHIYGGHPEETFPWVRLAGKPIWQTEYSRNCSWSLGGTEECPTGVLSTAIAIHKGLTGAQISAWVWFGLFHAWIGDNEQGGLIGYDRVTGTTFAGSKMLYVLGNFSKFIRPGFVRIGATVSSAPANFYVSAYKDPAMGQLVIVVINDNATGISTNFNVGFPAVVTPYTTSAGLNLAPGAEISLSTVWVPPKSVVTYVAQSPRRVSDILWRKTDGSTMLWLNAIAGTANYPGTLGTAWQVKGVGDFDGNGRGDILWRHTGGANMYWRDGIGSGATTLSSRDPSWRLQGVGNFDNNGKSDLVWRCVPIAPATSCGSTPLGTVQIWFDGGPTGAWQGSAADLWYAIDGIGDFDGNGTSDILWRRSVFGENVIWMNGTANTTYLGGLDYNWKVAGIGDFDGNGRSDILWRCIPEAPNTTCGAAVAGAVAIWHDANAGATTWPGALDYNWQVHGVGDFDGNGSADILWRCLPQAPAIACGNAPAGSTAIWQFANGAYGWTSWPGVLDNTWQIQATGRFDY